MIQTFRCTASVMAFGENCDHIFRDGIYDGFYVDGVRRDLSSVAAPFKEGNRLEDARAMLDKLGFVELQPA